MAPRGRPKKGKSRMDAAIDSMMQFGFSKELVRLKMKTLLKEYGGDEGYPFIESDAYRVLIEALLADVEEGGQEEDGQNGGQDEDRQSGGQDEDRQNGGHDDDNEKKCADGETSTKDNSLEVERAQDHAVSATPGSLLGFFDIPVCSSPTLNASAPPLPTIPARRRKPCYGWISDDDEEPHLIVLTPAIKPPLEAPPAQPAKLTRKKTKRRTRWDLKPEDM